MPAFWKWGYAVGTTAEQRQVKAAQAGDRAAFDALVYAHQNRLRAFLARRVGSEAADDVFQETLIGAWQAIPRLDLKVRFKTWLYGVAVHKAADFCRSRGRRTAMETALDPVAPETAGVTEGGYRQFEQGEAVSAILKSLPEEQREILEMYYFAELTLPEIATILNRNLNTLKYQFYRAHAVAAERGADWSDSARTEKSKEGRPVRKR